MAGYNVAIWPTDQVGTLPIQITYTLGAGSNIDTSSAIIKAGNLRIRLVSSLNEYSVISNKHQFRYIIIPGGVKNDNALHRGLVSGKGMSYADVCQLLGIAL